MKTKQIKLGNILLENNVFMAPLTGYTNYPFRMLCYEMGAGLCYTEMISCNALKYKDRATKRLLLTTKNEKIKAGQILGAQPFVIEKIVNSDNFEKFDIIDINMGCPVPNVFKSGEGSALLNELKKSSKIIKCCKKSGKVVTVKCRVGLTKEKLIAAEFAKMCEDSGADMITIHGRTRNMMYEGTPYFEQIEQAKSVVDIPVIANGGIFSKEDADYIMKQTNADGVMIARYALENPFIFSELTKREIKKDKKTLLLEQIKLTSEYYDETYTLEYIKKLAAYFMKKKKGTKKYKLDLYKCGSIKELEYTIEEIYEKTTNNEKDPGGIVEKNMCEE